MLVRVLPPAGASVSQPAVSANQCSFYKNALYKFTVITVLFGTGEIWQVNVHTMQRIKLFQARRKKIVLPSIFDTSLSSLMM